MKSISSARALFLACALAAATATSACSSTDLAGNDLQTVSLSFTTTENGGPSIANASVSGTSSTPAVVPAISKVQLVLTKMELGRTDDVACVDDDEGDDDKVENASSTPPVSGHDCEHVSRDPVLIDMPVDGTLRTQLSVPLAAGTYRKIEAKLEPANNKKAAGAAFLVAHPDFAGISIKVDGTFNGAAFTYKSAMRVGIHMKFSPPLVIDATTKNATISVNVSKWFVSGSGEVIDPSKATPGTSAAKKVESNIRASFHAFKDNEKRGKDHGEGHREKGDK